MPDRNHANRMHRKGRETDVLGKAVAKALNHGRKYILEANNWVTAQATRLGVPEGHHSRCHRSRYLRPPNRADRFRIGPPHGNGRALNAHAHAAIATALRPSASLSSIPAAPSLQPAASPQISGPVAQSGSVVVG